MGTVPYLNLGVELSARWRPSSAARRTYKRLAVLDSKGWTAATASSRLRAAFLASAACSSCLLLFFFTRGRSANRGEREREREKEKEKEKEKGKALVDSSSGDGPSQTQGLRTA